MDIETYKTIEKDYVDAYIGEIKSYQENLSDIDILNRYMDDMVTAFADAYGEASCLKAFTHIYKSDGPNISDIVTNGLINIEGYSSFSIK